MLGDILTAAWAFVLILSLGVAVSIFLKIATTSSSEYERRRKLAGTRRQILLGQANVDRDGSRDFRVAAGLAYDLKKKEFVSQGKLSSECFE